jgi:diguanylate cyclase (GGDEF)-like protein
VDLELYGIQVSTTFALAVVATVGYLCGSFRHRNATRRMEKDLAAAQSALGEIEQVKELIQSWNCCAREGKACDASPCMENTEPADSLSSDTLALAEVRTDSLTRLPHRDVLEQALTKELARLGRYETPFSLVLVDIDHLKNLNEEHGHLHGDYALQQLARLLAAEIRGIDMAARSEGDEFAVLLPETGEEGAIVFGERVRVRVQEQLPFTVSLAVAVADCIDTPASLLDRARAAMHNAKAAGRNCVRGCTKAPEPVHSMASGGNELASEM